MVRTSERQARFLGLIMLVGSTIGVAISLLSVVWLAIAGSLDRPWPIAVSGWWPGDYPGVKFLAGTGILILAATPVLMLVTFCIQSVREGQYRTVLTAVGLLAILTLGLLMNLLQPDWVTQPF